tara:strand:- start:467 stop:727 length:261 start_codon:yes stop_codon:yes gene_type:complete
MQDTSRLAYKNIQKNGTSAIQKEIIFNLIVDYPEGLTLKEISRKTNIEINAVSGRVNDLKKDFLLETTEKRRCKITGHLVSPVILV